MLREQDGGQEPGSEAPIRIPGLKPGHLELHDAQLLRRIAENDQLAFEALYRSFFPRLTRFLDRMTRSPVLIEQIVNDTLFVVWRKAETYDRTCKVSTWIFSIAYRTALKAIKGIDEPVAMDFDTIAAETSFDPERKISQRQIQKCVSNALDALPLEQRTVVNLTYYHSMGYQEIAEIMECPVNTVKTRMYHARKRLRVLLSSVME